MTDSKEDHLRKVAEKIDPTAFKELVRGWTWDNEDWDDWQRKLARERDEALTKAAQIDAEYAEEIGRLRADKDRLDWLEMRVVKVADALVYGSRHLFYASPDDSYEGEIGPSDLRAKVDEALALSTVPPEPSGAGEP